MFHGLYSSRNYRCVLYEAMLIIYFNRIVQLLKPVPQWTLVVMNVFHKFLTHIHGEGPWAKIIQRSYVWTMLL